MTGQSIQRQTKLKILLLGDACIDEYHFGTVNRISPEAPIPIFEVSYVQHKNGMVRNVENNLIKLGCDVTTVFGKQSVKQRFIDIRSKQQIIRVDNDIESEPLNADSITNINDYDCVVISDYNKGFISYDVILSIRNRFVGPMFLDTKKPDLAKFNGIIVKVNELEYNNRTSDNDNLIVTLGDKGAMYKSNDEKHYACPSVEVVDVTGAGDTFLAALTYEFLNTSDIDKSIGFAIKASSISIQHIGCYAPSLEEICG